jgi:hypothetical protein
MSIASGRPPDKRYVDRENKKSKNYTAGLKPLWYSVTGDG